MKDGIINIYKEKDYTSFDVVAILRKLLKTKKIGHTGTLDPQAEGVLPVCIGKATKVVDFLTDKTKTYAATLKLGFSTDTQDHTGQVLQTRPVNCSSESILEVINGFVGPYSQIPPMYSALKVNGKKLYELAREGITIDRKARDVIIYEISDIELIEQGVFFRVTCSKGTYIRTLCHDIGEILGCGAHMTSLIRERTGEFQLINSLKLADVKRLVEEERVEEVIMDIDQVYLVYPEVIISEAFNKELYNGNKMKTNFFTQSIDLECDMSYRVYDSQHHFVGIYRYTQNHNGELELKPVTVFL